MIVGKLVGLDPAVADSVSIALKNGTGEIIYSQTHLSPSNTFNFSSRETGGLLLDVTCPGFNPVQAPILTIGSTSDSVEIRLSPVSNRHDESRITFHDSTSLVRSRNPLPMAVVMSSWLCRQNVVNSMHEQV